MKRLTETTIALAIYAISLVAAITITASAIGVFVGVIWAAAQCTKSFIIGL